MFSILSLVFAVLVPSFVFSAPVPALDAATLLKNGQDAQHLNAAFQDLTLTDSCTTGEHACINGVMVLCQNSKWQSEPACPKSLQCFAIPSLTGPGTSITCTSKKTAASIIDASGAKGGIAVAGTNSTSGPTTVTVTITAQATTLAPQTRTLSPQEASSFLSSLTAGGQFSVVSTLSPSPTPAASQGGAFQY